MSFTEWAVEGGIDHDTRRQQKNRRRYDGADSHYRRRRAGGWAAKTLRDEGFSGEICVVAEEQWDFYERPPLSKAALLEAEPALRGYSAPRCSRHWICAGTARCARNRSTGKIKPRR